MAMIKNLIIWVKCSKDGSDKPIGYCQDCPNYVGEVNNKLRCYHEEK
jgi:hypothetical protein